MPHRTSVTDGPNEAAFRAVQALIEQSEGKEPRRRRARATRGPQGRQGPCGEAVCKEAIRHCEKRGSGTMECPEGLAVSATLSVLQGFPGRDLIIRAVVNHGPIEQ